MIFSFHLHGTPSGYQLYPADGNESLFLRHLMVQDGANTTFLIERREALVHYTLVKHGLEPSRKCAYAALALTLTFHSTLCLRPMALKQLMDKVLLESKLFQREDDILRIAGTFANCQSEIEELESALRSQFAAEFSEDDWQSFQELAEAETLDAPPLVLSWHIGEEAVVEQCLKAPFIFLSQFGTEKRLYTWAEYKRKSNREWVWKKFFALPWAIVYWCINLINIAMGLLMLTFFGLLLLKVTCLIIDFIQPSVTLHAKLFVGSPIGEIVKYGEFAGPGLCALAAGGG